MGGSGRVMSGTRRDILGRVDDRPTAEDAGRSAAAGEALVRLSAFDVGCIVVGGIIGVGIFFTPRNVALACDDPAQVIVAWCLGGAIAILGALVFAELSARVPDAGGMFAYVHAAFGRFPAFLYGWSNWLVIQSGALGVIGLVMVDYGDRLVYGEPRTGTGAKVAIAAGAIALFTVLNALGLRVGRGVQNLLTVLKTTAVAALVVLAIAVAGRSVDGDPADVLDGASTGSAPVGWLAAMAAAILPVLFSFGGWQQGSFVAAAARSPRTVAVGILGGVGVVVLAYLAVNLAFLSLLGFEGARASEAIGADAARVALDGVGLGEHASRAFAFLVVLSSAGILNTICLAPPYVLHAMAQRGLFPAPVGRIHPTLGAPVLAVVCQGGFAILLLVVTQWMLGQDLGFLLDGVVFVDWMFFVLCGSGMLLLRRRGAGAAGFRAPGGTWIAIVFTLLALGVMAGAIWQSPNASLAGLAVVAVGAAVFAAWTRRR